ncbi:hypothetical protein BVY03_01965 [bacterium K02(2017)]|nr:hypothetical protein BVY03_01965 [bacterium K02(2017)]
MSTILKYILIITFLFHVPLLQAKKNPRPLYTEPVHLNEKTEQDFAVNQSSKGKKTKKSWNKKKKSKRRKGKKRLWEYKRSHFNYYSVNNEIEIGKRYMKKQVDVFNKKKLGVNPNFFAKDKKRIDKIVKRLAAVSDQPDLPFEVTIFDKKDVANAYCLPGGKIGVFTGIFDKQKGLIDLKSDDEIAAVLAHEIAHATMRHVTRRMTTYNSLGILGNLLTIGIGGGAGTNWGYLASQVFNTGTYLFLPGYSRKHEREADKVGFYYMVKAGFDPQAAITVWDRAAKRKKKKGKKSKTNFFASHPASGERADALRAYLNDAKLVIEKQQMIKKMY